jgi:hypothetical protein
MTILPLFVSGMADKLATFVIKCLAVGGGFLAGFLFGWALAAALNRWVFRSKVGPQVVQLTRLVFGLVVAVLVALIIFGEGGGGLFGHGRGEGEGKGTASENTSKDQPAPPKADDPNKATTPPEARPAEVVIPVTILGGTDVRDERFYVVGTDRAPKTFAEARAAISATKAAEKRKVSLAILLSPPPNRLPLDHRAVTQLTNWAKDEAGLDVTFPAGR